MNIHPRIAGFLSTLVVCGGIVVGGCDGGQRADGLTVAVAANFYATAQQVAKQFERRQAVSVTLISGSTGKLYAQITGGAPYDVFLAADAARPAQLEAEGYAVAGSGFVYARGRLALWSLDATRIAGTGDLLRTASGARRFAIANPALAPYGVAAQQVLEHFGAWQRLADRLVMGENAAQAYTLVATGNAELGLVALPQVLAGAARIPGSRWEVPTGLHAPIEQRAVLLKHGADKAAAQRFLRYLREPQVVELIENAGYEVDES